MVCDKIFPIKAVICIFTFCVCSGQNMLCHLISEEEGSVSHAAVKHAGSSPKQYQSEALQKVWESLYTALAY